MDKQHFIKLNQPIIKCLYSFNIELIAIFCYNLC